MSLPDKEKQHIKSQYKSHVLFRLCRKVRDKFQNLHPAVTISVEELFVDAAHWIDILLGAEDETLDLCSDLWNDLLEMYWQRDSKTKEMENSMVKVAMQFYLLLYCLKSAPPAPYRSLLLKELSRIIGLRWKQWHSEPFKSQLEEDTAPLAKEMERWMAAYVVSGCPLLGKNPEAAPPATPEDSDRLPLPPALDTERAQTYFRRAIAKGWMSYAQGRFTWRGVTVKGYKTQLAYFCGKVYECDYSLSDRCSGNMGKHLPGQALEELFGINRIHKLIQQCYEAKSPQHWRSTIDKFFQPL